MDSVESQTYPNWEMLIIDDGSTDNSEKIVNQYVERDSRIKLIKQKNAGSAAARNNGIRHAQGQYIALLDSDDIWLPEFLNDQIGFMSENKAFCVCSSYRRIDKNSDETLSPVIAKPVITLKDMEAID
ncbi:glycosyltransferase, partial [Faecalibacillus intestinalis]|nr:glycosyltransferase [Faecalibacillus intestinalis]